MHRCVYWLLNNCYCQCHLLLSVTMAVEIISRFRISPVTNNKRSVAVQHFLKISWLFSFLSFSVLSAVTLTIECMLPCWGTCEFFQLVERTLRVCRIHCYKLRCSPIWKPTTFARCLNLNRNVRNIKQSLKLTNTSWHRVLYFFFFLCNAWKQWKHYITTPFKTYFFPSLNHYEYVISRHRSYELLISIIIS